MHTVLIVEDEWLVAEALKVDLEEHGFAVLGPAFGCSDALAILAEHHPDLAFVDTQLGDETCEVVLDDCDKRGISVVIFSGHSDEGLPAFARGRKVLAKPYLPRSLEDLLADAFE